MDTYMYSTDIRVHTCIYSNWLVLNSASGSNGSIQALMLNHKSYEQASTCSILLHTCT